MPSKQINYQQPMYPWPSLADYGKHLRLPEQGLTLFYFETGTKHQKTLLMLHGLGDEADTWRHIFHDMGNTYHTLALDLPGFGRSDKPDVAYTPPFLIGTVIEFMDHAGITEAIILGSSLGGILAHAMAITYPERVCGLILVGGGLLQTDRVQDLSLIMMSLPFLGEWLYTRLRKNPDAAYSSLSNVYHQLEGLPEADREFLYTRVNQRVWSDGQRRAYLSTLRGLSPWMKKLQTSIRDQFSHLQVPTLVIRGEFDSLFQDSAADAIVECQPNAAKAIIERAGHLPHQEDPHQFLQIVELWLSQHF